MTRVNHLLTSLARDADFLGSAKIDIEEEWVNYLRGLKHYLMFRRSVLN